MTNANQMSFYSALHLVSSYVNCAKTARRIGRSNHFIANAKAAVFRGGAITAKTRDGLYEAFPLLKAYVSGGVIAQPRIGIQGVRSPEHMQKMRANSLAAKAAAKAANSEKVLEQARARVRLNQLRQEMNVLEASLAL